MLKLSKHTAQDTTLCPAIYVSVDSMPVAEAFGQPSSLAPMLGNVKNGIENLQVGMADVATLTRQAVFDSLILHFCNFHHQIISSSVNRPQGSQPMRFDSRQIISGKSCAIQLLWTVNFKLAPTQINLMLCCIAIKMSISAYISIFLFGISSLKKWILIHKNLFELSKRQLI